LALFGVAIIGSEQYLTAEGRGGALNLIYCLHQACQTGTTEEVWHFFQLNDRRLDEFMARTLLQRGLINMVRRMQDHYESISNVTRSALLEVEVILYLNPPNTKALLENLKEQLKSESITNHIDTRLGIINIGSNALPLSLFLSERGYDPVWFSQLDVDANVPELRVIQQLFLHSMDRSHEPITLPASIDNHYLARLMLLLGFEVYVPVIANLLQELGEWEGSRFMDDFIGNSLSQGHYTAFERIVAIPTSIPYSVIEYRVEWDFRLLAIIMGLESGRTLIASYREDKKERNSYLIVDLVTRGRIESKLSTVLKQNNYYQRILEL